MTVLLVAPWGPLSLAFARSLHRQGVDTYLLQAAAQNRFRGSFPALRGSTTIPARLSGTGEGIDLLKRYATAVGASALVAAVDSELIWLGRNRHQFEPSCRLLVPPPDALHRLQSKRHQLDLAARAGLSVQPTYLLMRPDDAKGIPDHDLPLVLRPDRPDEVHPGFKVRLVRSREELERVIRASRILSPLIGQPFQSLPNLVVHGARTLAGDVIASRCYLVSRKFEGVSLSIESWPFPNALEERCHEFATLADITGCYHFEFLFSPADQRAFFLEVNVRLGGTTDKVVRTGFDEPRLLLETYGLLSRSPASRDRGSGRVVNKRVLLKHMVWAATGKLTPLDYPDAGRVGHLAHSLRDMIVAKDSVFDWRDLPGSVKFQLRR